MKVASKLFPVFVVSLAVVYLAWAAMPPSERDDEFHFAEFAKIPVQENGRIMPLDTYARTKLMMLSHQQSVYLEVFTKDEQAILVKALRDGPGVLNAEEKKVFDRIQQDRIDGRLKKRTVQAPEWLLCAMLYREMPVNPIHDMRMFRIDSDDLLQFLDLKKSRQFGFWYRLDDILANEKLLVEAAKIQAAGGPRKDDPLANKVADVARGLIVLEGLGSVKVPFAIPPRIRGVEKDVADEQWMSLKSAAHVHDRGEFVHAFDKILLAYQNHDVAKFNRSVDEYLALVQRHYPSLLNRPMQEVAFNRFAAYWQCAALFICVFVLACLSWTIPSWSQPLRVSAFALGVLTTMVYGYAIIQRIYLSGYPPVTTLYSSAVFIGFGCAFLCLGLELILRNGIGSAVAAALASVALIIAYNLVDGDTMGKIVAVLESNFWLSTHVICITLGYVATFVAGFLGIVYVIGGRFTNAMRGRDGVMVGKVLYGVICFAMFLSFVGTVLGGIWADQSWGRFWGWDPKENGALLIVIWNALILHARWAGLCKTRGMAMLAIIGNVVTAWSWFGTNFLGVGLHSYGFMKGAQLWLAAFAASQFALMLVGVSPLNQWESFRPDRRQPA